MKTQFTNAMKLFIDLLNLELQYPQAIYSTVFSIYLLYTYLQN